MKKTIRLMSLAIMLVVMMIILPSLVLAASEEQITGNDLVITAPIGPINGEKPITSFTTPKYTAVLEWRDSNDALPDEDDVFSARKIFKAKITLTPKVGYTFTGVTADNIILQPAQTFTLTIDDNGVGVLEAVFVSPPNGYLTDGHGYAAYKASGDSIDILSHDKGNWMGTTYSNKGYGTIFKYDNEAPQDVDMVNTPVEVGHGIFITVAAKFSPNGGKFVNISYTLKNTSDTDAIVSFGSHADIEIDGDDRAHIEKFADNRGFKMIKTNGGRQFNFFGKNTLGANDIDTFWYGHYRERSNNVFNQVTEDSYDGDSGMAYSYKDRTIPAGQTRDFTVIMGTGDAASGDSIPVGVNFDSQGGSAIESIPVETVGDVIVEPTPPTKDGYFFGGWYTEPECINKFDFTTPITSTVTLYAKWDVTPPIQTEDSVPPVEPIITNPSTLDQIMMFAISLMVSGIGLLIGVSTFKKQNYFNK